MWILEITLAIMLLVRRDVAEEVAEGAAPDCKCVPYKLCEDDIIDLRLDCDHDLDVCCKKPLVAALHNKTCGNRNLEGVGFRINDNHDNEAQFGELPWMVAVLEVLKVKSSTQIQKRHWCGGSLIHPSVVLTAAHCVAAEGGTSFIIRAGEWDTLTNNELYEHQDRDVKRIVVHEDYQGEKKFNDVALLFLSDPVLPAENIGFACLPAQGFLSGEGTHCVTSGWGKDMWGKGGQQNVILEKVELSVVDNQQCETLLRNTSLGQYFNLHKSFVCAGGEKIQETCKGYEGSPLVCPLKNNKSKYIQSGIMSWGTDCGEDKIPGVYANVADFRNWIDIKMSEAGYETSYYTY